MERFKKGDRVVALKDNKPTWSKGSTGDVYHSNEIGAHIQLHNGRLPAGQHHLLSEDFAVVRKTHSEEKRNITMDKRR